MRLRPAYKGKSLFHLEPWMLHEMGKDVLLLDLDNTLDPHDVPLPSPGRKEWADGMKEEGVLLLLVSNNRGRRVRMYAEALGIPFLSGAGKPFPCRTRRFLREKGIDLSRCLLCGDQVLTDLWGARNLGVPAILLEPISHEEAVWTRINRVLEKRARRRIMEDTGIPVLEETWARSES